MHRKLESLVLFIMEVLIRIMDKKSYISFGFIWVSIKQKFCLYKDLIKFFFIDYHYLYRTRVTYVDKIKLYIITKRVIQLL
jgi:hypothetical protein